MFGPQQPSRVSQRTSLAVHSLNGGAAAGRTVEGIFVYACADPYAVELIFPSHPDIKWDFARDLLREGQSDHAGMGDVQIWSYSVDHLLLRLISPSGTIELLVGRQFMRQFLKATAQVVAFGTESSYLDLDAEIAHLGID